LLTGRGRLLHAEPFQNSVLTAARVQTSSPIRLTVAGSLSTISAGSRSRAHDLNSIPARRRLTFWRINHVHSLEVWLEERNFNFNISTLATLAGLCGECGGVCVNLVIVATELSGLDAAPATAQLPNPPRHNCKQASLVGSGGARTPARPAGITFRRGGVGCEQPERRSEVLRFRRR